MRPRKNKNGRRHQKKLQWWVQQINTPRQRELIRVVSPSIEYDPLVKMIVKATGLIGLTLSAMVRALSRIRAYNEELTIMGMYKIAKKIKSGQGSE